MFRHLLFVALASLIGARAAAAPLSAYARLPNIESVSVSPSGHALALVASNGDQRMIVVKRLSDGVFTLRAGGGDAKVRQLIWAGDKHLVVVTSATASPMFVVNARREWMTAFILDLEKQKATPMLRDVEYGLNTIFDMPVVRHLDGEPVVFVEGVQFAGGRGQRHLYRVGLKTARSRLAAEGSENTRDWIVGPDGGAVAQELYDMQTARWTLKLRSAIGWREVESIHAPVDPPNLVGLGRNGDSVMYVMRDADGGRSWREVLLDGKPAKGDVPLEQGEIPVMDPQDGRLIGRYALRGEVGRYAFFDAADDAAWQAVLGAYPGELVDLVSWSGDRRKIVVRVDSPTEGPAFALVDVAARKATWIGPEYVGLKSADVAIKETVRFKAADGLGLSGYLTRPRDRAPAGLPLVVLPHGGPASRDLPGFDWMAQAIASRGFAVLQVNFRGSEGLGPGLLSAGYGEWGRKMQSDLSDGVRHLAGQGVIDPKRVCIVGASYGGYAALAGATIDLGVYRCAVSIAGVSDLRKQIAYSRNRGGAPTERYWNRFLGAEDRGDAVLAEYSPAQLAHRAEIPILMIHGKDDTVVPLEQSRIMAEALSKAGKPHELVVFKGEDHWLSRGDTRLQTLEATMAFVEKHNPPVAAASKEGPAG